jgi:hypothetical protein
VYNFLVGKSIYVSISCLGYDTELEQTVDSALEKSSKNNTINIGLSFSGNTEFLNYFKTKYKDYKNIKMIYTDIKDAFGVAKGRILSASMYDDEDYFLQIDAHTLFRDNWDIDLIQSFEKAIKFLDNEKVIISAPLGEYWYEQHNDKEIIKYSENLGYTKWLPGQFWMNTVPKFTDMPTELVSEKLKAYLDNNGLIPAAKIIGMFIFGNSHFAKNLCIDESIIFWEEEIFQSIDLIDNGFTLVHPNIKSPMFHFPFYRSNEQHHREDFDIFLKTMGISLDQYEEMVKSNYLRLADLEENKEKILRYESYTGINIIKGAESFDLYPKYFINSNSDIINI